MFFAGRSKAERTFGGSVVIGSIILGACFVVFLVAKAVTGSSIFDGFIILLTSFASGKVEGVSLVPLVYFLGAAYLLSIVAGLSELLLVTRLSCPQKGWLKVLKLLSGEKFPRFQVKPGHLLFDILVAYRIVGKRPLVKVWHAEKELTGECLRYAWDSGESLLIRDADNPGIINWVYLKEVSRIEFLNEIKPLQEEHCAGGILSEQDKLLFDLMICPGYSDEVEEYVEKKLRGK